MTIILLKSELAKSQLEYCIHFQVPHYKIPPDISHLERAQREQQECWEAVEM